MTHTHTDSWGVLTLQLDLQETSQRQVSRSPVFVWRQVKIVKPDDGEHRSCRILFVSIQHTVRELWLILSKVQMWEKKNMEKLSLGWII